MLKANLHHELLIYLVRYEEAFFVRLVEAFVAFLGAFVGAGAGAAASSLTGAALGAALGASTRVSSCWRRWRVFNIKRRLGCMMILLKVQ
jgi:hypothetical protein